MSQSNSWSIQQVLTLAIICFLVGGTVGYLAHAPVAASAAVQSVGETQPSSPAPAVAAEQANPSSEELKAASVKAAGTVLDKLKADPKNFDLLVAAGEMYYHHGAFSDSAPYYDRALAVKDDIAVRNRYASALFYGGDADGALKQYEKVLAKQPTNDVALFNQGMILLKAKNDRAGAIESWKKLLAAYPNHPHKDQVQKMIDTASKQG